MKKRSFKKLVKSSLSILLAVLVVALALPMNLLNAKAQGPAPVQADKISVTGAAAKISNTGTVPFDVAPGPGKDVSPDDLFVRTLDNIGYRVEFAVNTKDIADENTYTNDVIIKVKMPSAHGSWDTSIYGAGVFAVTTVGTDTVLTLTLESRTGQKVSQNFNFIVGGVPNGTKIQPVFEVSVKGNQADTPVICNVSAVEATSSPNLNVRAVQGTHDNVELTFNGKKGCFINFAFEVGAIGSAAAGKRGLEFPKGPITFDVSFDASVTVAGVPTNIVQPSWNLSLFDYGKNREKGKLGNYLSMHNDFSFLNTSINGNRTISALDSGKFTVGTESQNKVNVKIEEYKIDGLFPTRSYNTNYTKYEDHEAYFSGIVISMFVPFNDQTMASNWDVPVTATVSNVKYTTQSGQTITTQDTSDDRFPSIAYQRVGNFSAYPFTGKDTVSYSGDGTMSIGETIPMNFHTSQTKSRTLPGGVFAGGRMDLNKFDPKAFEVVPLDGTNDYVVEATKFTNNRWEWYTVDPADYTVQFGLGAWASETELMNSTGDELAWLSVGTTLAGAKAQETATSKISAFRIITTDPAASSGTAHRFRIGLKARETANITQGNNVYIFDQYCELYRDAAKTDVDKQSFYDYEKTTFGDNGIKNGGHKITTAPPASIVYNATSHGNSSIRIIGYTVGVSKTTDRDGVPQQTYNLALGNEVIWKISPKFQSASATSTMTEKVTIVDTLPKGLTYVAGSSTTGGQPFEPAVTVGANGTTTLTWTYDGWKVNDVKPPIFFKTEIDPNSADQQAYTNSVVISAPRDLRSASSRSAAYGIKVANATNMYVEKTVADADKIIEIGGDLVYTLKINTGTTDVFNISVLDKLPLGGDGRGTDFSGSYTVSSITGPTGMTTKYSQDSQDNISDDPINPGPNLTWTPYSNGANPKATALRFEIPSILKNTEAEITIRLRSAKNIGGDIYGNHFSASSPSINSFIIHSNNVIIRVVDRILAGTAFLDQNRNGDLNVGEEVFANTKVKLLDNVGNPIINPVTGLAYTALTGADGEYYFDNIPEGNGYQLVFEPSDESYDVTKIPSPIIGDSNRADKTYKITGIDFPKTNTTGVGDAWRVEDLHANIGLVSPYTYIKSSNPGTDVPVLKGDTITYTITLENKGLNAVDILKNPFITDVVPAGSELVAGSISDGGSVDGAGKITWLLDDLASGKTKAVSFAVKVTGTIGDVLNSAVVYGDDHTNEVRSPLISYTKSSPTIPLHSGGTLVMVGDVLTYNITVNNLSNKEVKGIVVKDGVPVGTTFVVGSATASLGVYKDNAITWTVDIPANGTLVLVFEVKVAFGNDLMIENTAQVNDKDTNEVTFDVEPDTDGDGLTDLFEIEIGTDPAKTDTDGDGLSDFDEVRTHKTDPSNPDSDEDGLSDGDEFLIHKTDPLNPDTDGDGLTDGDEFLTHKTDPLNPDTDDDGLTDGDEFLTHKTDPLNPDSDGDGLTDGDEFLIHKTDPLNPDSDEDGLTDGDEFLIHNTDPLNPDSDEDGLTDGDEFLIHNTDPLNPDSDEDGLTDGDEFLIYETDPLNPDSDEDGLTDGDEVLIYETDPLNPDTDGDGLSDYEEVHTYKTDPLNTDTDGDGLSDYDEVHTHKTDPLNPDTDGDGLTDGEEFLTYKTDPLNPDSDEDGLTDGAEVHKYKTDPLNPDTDGDGLTDGDEVLVHKTDPLNPDTDGDGLTDGDEVLIYKTDPLKSDTDGGGISDGDEVLKYKTNPLDASDDAQNLPKTGDSFNIATFMLALSALITVLFIAKKRKSVI